MNNIMHHLRTITLTAGLCMTVSGPLLAEDIEVYVGSTQTASTVKPNLVFIIDTSGSMSSDVTSTVTSGAYDPAVTYSGDCDTSRVYWSTTGNPPSCSTSQYVNTSANKCNASVTGLTGSSGFYVGHFARFRSRRGEDRWDDLSNNNHTESVECKGDWGVHGESGATDPYPADENDGGPWRADSTNAINWDTFQSYTFYSANYLNWRESASTTITNTRLEVVQQVFSNLMDSISNINVAVMRFDSASQEDNHAGYFVMPMQELNDSTRASYKTAVNALTTGGYTPLSETLYESYLFYRGASVLYGDESSPGTNVAGVLDATDTTQYDSPVEYQCQKNFVIFLTDGEPTYDTDTDDEIEALSGFSAVTGSASCSGNCLDELAQYMYSKDCSTGLDDTQNVITYTIGFTTNQTLLEDAARKGGGTYHTADDVSELTDAFTSVLTDILAINTSFIAPAVSVNAFNRFNHRDELYYALFRPASRPNWYGNIKRFKLTGTPPTIKDQNNVDAVDANTGFFKSSATSYWTLSADAPDGDDVTKGGAASILSLTRSVYTYTSSDAPDDADLTATGNALSEDNSAITKTMLGDAAMTDEYRTNLLKWARGVDVLDEDSDGSEIDARRFMGDPLHAKPLLVTYGGTDLSPDMTLYAGTNAGFLHAINTSDGSEVFSFIPQELLPNLRTLYNNAAGTAHPYGLDGPLSMWFNDVNNNGVLLSSGAVETGEHIYLYQGMRRGGKNYYAFDVTDRAAPTLKWVISGGSGDFVELAQTWSTATKAKIKLNNVEKNVLIFSGGYDTNQDSNDTAEDDSEGRAIFIVDADTGAKLWQAGPAGSDNGGADPDLVLSAMTNSIPSDITVFDITNDGYVDRMYVGDMRGQLWRFDINNANTGPGSLATGGVIAQLGSSTAASNRRFYYAPDVSLSEDRTYLNIAIGSGYREHPLDTDIHDAFYIIRDTNVYTAPATYTAITPSDLYDATDNVIGEGTAADAAAAVIELNNSDGLYISLETSAGAFVGEKVLAKSVTFNGVVMFTTYTPVASASSACSPSQGTARLYMMSVTDATPISDLDLSGSGSGGSGGSSGSGSGSGDDDLTREDRHEDLVRGGLPPELTILFNTNGLQGCVGAECDEAPDLDSFVKKIGWQTKTDSTH